MDEIRIHAIPTANDDGSQPPWVNGTHIQKAVVLMNQVYLPANIRFLFDPLTDIDPVRYNTLLNHDCTLASDANMNSPKEVEPKCDYDVNGAERNRVANEYLGKLVIYFSSGDRPLYNDTLKKWEFVPRTYHWSNGMDSFVAMLNGDPGLTLAHEVGHYLHLGHTHYSLPKTMAEAIEIIRNYVDDQGNPPEQGANAFDGDYPGVTDTPPDPGPDLYVSAGLNPCNINQGVLTLEVPLKSGKRSYSIETDRENIMNYWDKTCRGLSPRISSGQILRVRDAVEKGNRQHLIGTRVMSDVICEAGSTAQSRVLGWAINDFALRFDRELAQDRHLVQMQAYDLGGGQIRWNAVWEPGKIFQSRAITWSFNDFAGRFDKELEKGRHVTHMQAYDIGGGQIRYDGVWELGNKQQTRAIAWTMNNFAQHFDKEISSGKRAVHVQAYDIGGGQMRWDGVWEHSSIIQTRAFGWSLTDFAKRFNDELAAGRHVVHMQAYDIGGGQIRYDGIWEPGDKQQSRVLSWAMNDFVLRIAEENSKKRHLVRMQSYNIGDGQIRWDGVWESGDAGQTHALSLTSDDIAVWIDKQLAGNQRILQIQTYTGG